MSKWRVLAPPSADGIQQAIYANEAIRQAEARAQAETTRREDERQRQDQIQATLATFAAERVKREEKEEQEKRERAAKRFEDDLRASFFAGNPGADESDWTRNRRILLDEAMRERAAGRGPVDLAREQLLARGGYDF